jgi:ABC-2 type transport system permease protein
MGSLRRHLAILRQYTRMGLIRRSQFRLEFVNQVVMDCCFYGSQLLTFGVLFGLEDGVEIAGWRGPAVAVYLGMVFVHDGFSMSWLGQSWFFGEDLKKGNLDPVRVRPGHPVLLYFFQRFSPEGCTNLLIASAILITACVAADANLLLLPWAVALACFGQTIFIVLISLAEFRFLHSDFMRFLDQSLGILSERPLDVYPAYLRRFLVFVVPAGAMSYIPASIVLGRVSVLGGLAYSAFYLAFGLVVLRAWRRGFRRYESAMG